MNRSLLLLSVVLLGCARMTPSDSAPTPDSADARSAPVASRTQAPRALPAAARSSPTRAARPAAASRASASAPHRADTDRAAWTRVEVARAGLEAAVKKRESLGVLAHVAATWIAARETPSGATQRVEELIGRLLGPAARLIKPENRAGLTAWGDWWLCVYEVKGAAAVVGLVRVGGRILVATCSVDQPQRQCCGRATTTSKNGPRCTVCEVDARTCICPRPGEQLLPDEDWQARCTLAQRTRGRALCRGCLDLLIQTGVNARLGRLEERLTRRRVEVKDDLARLARLIRTLDPATIKLESVKELGQRREELRRGQVAFTEMADAFKTQLDTSTQGTPRKLFKDLPEQRLADLERRLSKLRRAAQAQVEVVRQELARHPKANTLLPTAFPPTAPEQTQAPWLSPRAREGAALALAAARRAAHGTTEWHRLAALPPPGARVTSAARRRGTGARTLFQRAEACLLRDDLDGAIEYYRRAEAIQPLAPSRARRLARALLLRSVGLAGRGKLKQAVRDATAAIRHDPNDAWAWGHRGHCRRRQGELDQAVVDLRRAKRLGSAEASADMARLAALFAKRAWKRNAAGKSQAAVADWRMAWSLEVELGKRGKGAPPPR